MSTIDLELITIDNLNKLPPTVRELWPDELTPLDGKVYVYRAPTPIGGREYVKRFVERVSQ